MNFFSKKQFSLYALLTVNVISFGCGGGGGGGGGEGESNGDGVSAAVSEFRTNCGIVRETLVPSVQPEDGQYFANAVALAPNVVSVDPGSGPLVINLLGLASSAALPSQVQLAVQKLNELVSGGVFFYQRPAPCTVTTSTGGVAASGHLITPNGLDVAEELIKAGLGGEVVSSGTCGEELVAGCYQSLRQQFPPQTAGFINEFLWKPESGGDFLPGHLAVLINTDPCNVIIVANGEILQNYGPTNGRCMTSRSLTRTGCAFGANAKVEVFNEVTGLPYVFPDGNTFIINPNGCERLQYKL